MSTPKLLPIVVTAILSVTTAFAGERSFLESPAANIRSGVTTPSTDPSSPLKTPDGVQNAETSCSSQDGAVTCSCEGKCESSKSDCQCED